MSVKTLHLRFCELIATGLGVGYMPKMPGTWGSLVGGLIILVYRPELWSICLLSLGALWVTYYYEASLKEHDAKQIVIDEILGMFVAFLGVNANLPRLFVGFLIFRILDIWKPLLIGWADKKIPGALGVLIDDVLAGAMTCALLHMLIYYGVL